jgi:hypothetical protein
MPTLNRHNGDQIPNGQSRMKLIAICHSVWRGAALALCLWASSYNALALQNAQADLAWQQIRPGLLYARQDIPIEGTDAVHRLHWLRLNLTQPDLYLALTPQACAGLRMTALDREPIVASLNASFFTKEFFTRGHTVSQGTLWAGNYRALESPLLACTADRQCEVLHQAPARVAPQWSHAAAGVYSLVESGVPRTAADDAQCGKFCTTPHPRSAIGLDSSRQTMVWVAAEGRQQSVTGMPLAELAIQMAMQGVADAINFDGGGSTALHVDAQARTRRPDNEPEARPVANAWIVSSPPDVDWAAVCKPQQEPGSNY